MKTWSDVEKKSHRRRTFENRKRKRKWKMGFEKGTLECIVLGRVDGDACWWRSKLDMQIRKQSISPCLFHGMESRGRKEAEKKSKLHCWDCTYIMAFFQSLSKSFNVFQCLSMSTDMCEIENEETPWISGNEIYCSAIRIFPLFYYWLLESMEISHSALQRGNRLIECCIPLPTAFTNNTKTKKKKIKRSICC